MSCIKTVLVTILFSLGSPLERCESVTLGRYCEHVLVFKSYGWTAYGVYFSYWGLALSERTPPMLRPLRVANYLTLQQHWKQHFHTKCDVISIFFLPPGLLKGLTLQVAKVLCQTLQVQVSLMTLIKQTYQGYYRSMTIILKKMHVIIINCYNGLPLSFFWLFSLFLLLLLLTHKLTFNCSYLLSFNLTLSTSFSETRYDKINFSVSKEKFSLGTLLTWHVSTKQWHTGKVNTSINTTEEMTIYKSIKSQDKMNKVNI